MSHGQIKKHKCIEVIEFDPIHLSQIIPQEDQAEAYDNLPDNFADFVDVVGLSATIVDRDGNLVSVCGVCPNGDDGLSWAIHSDLFKHHYIEVTRAVRDFFSELAETGQRLGASTVNKR